MAMAPFYSRFRMLAFKEMRTVIVCEHESLPHGPYGFLEFYCNEPNCDCRRVLFHVVRPDSTRVWASINFGWEEPGFYRRWIPGDPEAAAEMVGPTLDPLNPQSEYSGALLALFRQVVANDPGYVRRLQRHYRRFKDAQGHNKSVGRSDGDSTGLAPNTPMHLPTGAAGPARRGHRGRARRR